MGGARVVGLMSGNRTLGSLLVAGGIVFLLIGMSLDRIGHGLIVLNGACGASLVTAGTWLLSPWSRTRLVALWVASFLLVYATRLPIGLASPVSAVILPIADIIIGGVSRARWLSRIAFRNSTVPLLLLLLTAAVILLVVLRARRKTPAPATTTPRADVALTTRFVLSRALGYFWLAALGYLAWFVVLLSVAALGGAGEAFIGVPRMVLSTSPIGLVTGILAGLWVYAERPGRPMAWRHLIAALFLLALPVLLGLLGRAIAWLLYSFRLLVR